MNTRKIISQNTNINFLDKLEIAEIIRLGILKDGIQLITKDIKLPIYGQVIPRIELELKTSKEEKRVTVRINQESPFMFDGEMIYVAFNENIYSIQAHLCKDKSSNSLGMYNFWMLRENGIRSFVFDYHTYCCYSCKFCFKENERENRLIEGDSLNIDYSKNFEKCLNYIEENIDKFTNNYDIIWLCTGSIINYEEDLTRNCTIASKLREIGYKGDIYLSQVIPKEIINDQNLRKEHFIRLKDSGVSRFNSWVEIVNQTLRKSFIKWFKWEITFSDYVNIFRDAIDIFWYQKVGSCLLIGLESKEESLNWLEQLWKLWVVPAPTVFTPFVIKQLKIPFYLSLDELIETHIGFNSIIKKYKLPVFSWVFSLA